VKELIDNIKQDAKDFTKKLAQESDVDLEKEELIGVENIIKVVDLERENQEKDKIIKQLKKENEELKNKLNALEQD